MTAEVAIANASAVALAADSAVTIGGQKIYNSALKLFSLSKIAPVGVMIYGNAGLLHVPWETLIKSFRKQLAGTTYETLEEYANDFIKYLQNKPGIFTKEAQADWIKGNVYAYFRLLQKQMIDELKPIFEEKGEVDAEAVSKALAKVISIHRDAFEKQPYADEMDESTFGDVREQHKDLFKLVKEQVFEEAKLSSATAAKLYDIAAFLHVKQVFSTGVSGIVIAGYGEEELYPSIVTFDIEGVVGDRLKYRRNLDKTHKIRAGMECRIIAFAQEDMVATFMNGLNPHVLQFLQSYMNKLFDRLPELIESEAVEEEEIRKFKSQSRKLLRGFFDEFGKHISEEHANPVLRMVTALPKDELAAMAEALVNLTAFKRRMTEAIETVGGPIDVAVISKGDGLVWVKRKHYFPPELNRPFFDNYFRGVRHGEEKAK
jgi:hypothetical protein